MINANNSVLREAITYFSIEKKITSQSIAKMEKLILSLEDSIDKKTLSKALQMLKHAVARNVSSYNSYRVALYEMLQQRKVRQDMLKEKDQSKTTHPSKTKTKVKAKKGGSSIQNFLLNDTSTSNLAQDCAFNQGDEEDS